MSHLATSVNHPGGQNVLRMDASAAWATTSNIGPGGDNIWDPTNRTSGDLQRRFGHADSVPTCEGKTSEDPPCLDLEEDLLTLEEPEEQPFDGE